MIIIILRTVVILPLELSLTITMNYNDLPSIILVLHIIVNMWWFNCSMTIPSKKVVLRTAVAHALTKAHIWSKVQGSPRKKVDH